MIGSARELVRSVLAECHVDPPHGFEWFGRRIPVPVSDGEDPGRALLRTLAIHLYLHVFCPGAVRPLLPPARESGAGEIRALMTAHSLANPDRDRWDAGWTYVESAPGESHVVRRRGLDFSVSSEGVRPRRGRALRAGREVAVLVPAERWSLSPGFMLFHGERLLHPRSAGTRRTRLYMDLDVDDSRKVIGMCRRFNEARLPFTLKVAAQPALYDDRCDTVVLFVEREDYLQASELLVEEATRAGLAPRAPTPAFTRRLGSGVAVADDPATAESFGELRCRLLAAGILRAEDAPGGSIEARLQAVDEEFLAAGVELDRAHLEPGSEEYDPGPWSPLSSSSSAGSRNAPQRGQCPSGSRSRSHPRSH